MAELVYAHDSKSCAARHVGSSPTLGTSNKFPENKWNPGGFSGVEIVSGWTVEASIADPLYFLSIFVKLLLSFMLSKIDFKKDLKKQLLTGIIISVLLLGVSGFFFWKIGDLSKEILVLREEIAKNQQLFDNFSSLKIQKREVAAIQQKILNILPTKDEILIVVGNIELLIANLDLKQSFAFGAEHDDKNSGTSSIGFSLTLSGGLDHFLQYLKKIENFPQFIQFGSVEITKTEKGYQINSAGRIYKK